MRFWKRNTLKVKRGPTLQMLPVGNLQSATTLRRSGRALSVSSVGIECLIIDFKRFFTLTPADIYSRRHVF